MFAPGIFQLLVSQHSERSRDACTGISRHDDIVDISPAAGDERVRKLFPVLFSPFRDLFRVAHVLAKNDLYGPFWGP